MNFLLSFTDEELDAAIDLHAEKIGHCSDQECDMHMKRMAQLERAKQSSHYLHDFERAA